MAVAAGVSLRQVGAIIATEAADNTPSSVDEPVLAAAVEGCHIGAVRLLLEAGAPVNEKCGQGRTALHASYAKDERYEEYPGDGYKELRNARHEVHRVLVDAGANVEAKDVEGQTPIFACIGAGHLDDVQELLETFGASADVGRHGPRDPADARLHHRG
jgi:ankyrin repeat protein